MRAKKVDKNQSRIVKLIRKYGATVFVLSSVGHGCPDLLVGFRGKNFLFEVKDGEKKKLTPDQLEFINNWKGNYHVIRADDDIHIFFKTFTVIYGKDLQNTRPTQS